MAFMSTDELTQKVIRRLRQVQGPSTQIYSNDAIYDHLQETYQVCREKRWWDHLTGWVTRQLDATTGKVTVPFTGASGGFGDVHRVFVGAGIVPLPIIGNENPARYASGTAPRVLEPLAVGEDPQLQWLFRVWPLAASVTVDAPLRVHLRYDPPGLFASNSQVKVPFDPICLINGAAAKYAADDASNPATVQTLLTVYNERLDQLQRQFDSRPMVLDPRMSDGMYPQQWMEHA